MGEEKQKIRVTWDDLRTRKVENRLKEQEAVQRTRSYSQMRPESAAAEATARSRAKKPRTGSGLKSLWYNSAVYTAAFGLAGGLLAWALGWALLQFKPSSREEAADLRGAMDAISAAQLSGKLAGADAQAALAEIRYEGRNNDYFRVFIDPNRDEAGRQAALAQLARRDRMRGLITKVLSYGLCGMVIALALGVADPATQRNWPGVVVNGSVAAALGLVGGVVVSLFADRLFLLAGGVEAVEGAAPGPANLTPRQIVARAITWGVLGLFLTIGPGVVMRNIKKLGIGLAAGLVGGLIGGALFDPLAAYSGKPELSRLVALLAIALVAGVGTGLIEHAAKTGWLRVIAGLISGKQFILYRNPTYIGSAPDCQIYLFKDPKVGRRHAAIHIVPGGFELEDLPLGAATMVNDKPVARARLRHGDRITVGATAFLFQEKKPG